MTVCIDDPGLIGYGVVAAAYLIGSIPFGLLLTKLAGYDDIRTIGSGNIGATNVLRTGNKALAFATLILDSGKGAAAFLFAYMLLENPNMRSVCPMPFTDFLLYMSAFAAILGHCFPIWLKFKGGKGVATTLGTLLAALPLAGLVACATWGIVAGFFRYSSLAALCAVAIAPLATFLIYGPVPALITIFITALVFIRHKSNIQRLLGGDEPKIGEKKKEAA